MVQGNVGIGTTNPKSTLHIEDSAASSLQGIRYTITGKVGQVYIGQGGASGYPAVEFAPAIVGAIANAADSFLVRGVARYNTDTGNTPVVVVTGATVDTEPFTGSTNLTNRPVLGVYNHANPLMVVRANGNVGIGTTEPGTALDLNGAFSLRQMSAPEPSPLNQGRLYFDSASKKFKVSENGAAYVDLTAGGGAMGYEQVSNTCSSNTCSAPCPAGKKILGGGCSFTSSIFLYNSYPSSNSWQCAYTGLGAGWSTAYAICANIQ